MSEIRYSVVCRGMAEGEGQHRRIICRGWGNWGQPDDKCPTCGQTVKVSQEVHVESVR